jgi:hypothetical protein
MADVVVVLPGHTAAFAELAVRCQKPKKKERKKEKGRKKERKRKKKKRKEMGSKTGVCL